MKFEEFMKQQEMNEETFIENCVERSYIPIIEKYEIAQSFANAVVEVDEKGFSSINNMFYDIISFYFIVSNYTNIEFDEDVSQLFDVYDMMSEFKETPSGKVLYNIEFIVDDIVFLKEIFQKEVNSLIEKSNSVINVILDFFENMKTQVPDIQEMNQVIDKTKETFEGFSTKKLGGINGVIKNFNKVLDGKKEE